MIGVAVLGGTGSVGKHVVDSLIKAPWCSKVILVSRRPLPEFSGHAKVEIRIADPLDTMDTSHVSGAQAGVCTVGIGSPRYASKEELMRVDAQIPGIFANKCAQVGVERMTLMTSVGANEASQYSSITGTTAGGGWYSHVKGVAERLFTEVGFKQLTIVRPAALLGSEHTPGIMSYVPNAILPQRFSSANVADIGRAIVTRLERSIQADSIGLQILEGGLGICDL
eukprot:m.459791 g.459791  ORF g.459791 m.459791 type:complete len:225 (+) comp21836_c0_seq2:869-1543(+)